MTKDEALKQALEALELHGEQYPRMVKGYCLDAIAAIREALAQPAREWVGLTEVEVGDLFDFAYANDREFVLNVEAKLKEKNT